MRFPRLWLFALLLVSAAACSSDTDAEGQRPDTIAAADTVAEDTTGDDTADLVAPADLPAPLDLPAPVDVPAPADVPAAPDAAADAPVTPDACTPACGGRLCGPDGCGGLCGTCGEGEECAPLGWCRCAPQCDGRACGPDGCGGDCGTCGASEQCSDEGRCVPRCIPTCETGCCGDDGCGGTCESRCTSVGLTCDPEACACSGAGVCGAPVTFPSCETVGPAPATDERAAFFAADARPVRCDGAFDMAPFAADFAGHRIFFFGEVHGSSELGPMSAAVFEYLVRTGAVNTVAMEMGTDATDAMNEYIRTGAGPMVDMWGLDRYPSVLFIRALLDKARALYVEGYTLTAFGADTPIITGLVVEDVRALAARVPTSGGVLSPLPEMDGYGMVDEGVARTWRARVLPALPELCAELADEAACDRLTNLVDALWVSAFTASGALYSATPQRAEEFFRIRENVIEYNYRVHMPTEDVRVFTHMGAAHAMKSSGEYATYPSVAERLETLYPVTAGAVYSTTPAYGAGSSIRYGYDIYDLGNEPPDIAPFLAPLAPVEHFLSTWRPGAACVERPFFDALHTDMAAPYRTAYDAFTWVPRLTPEPDSGWKAGLPRLGRLVIARRDALASAARR